MAEQKKSGCGCLTLLVVIVIAICVLVAGNGEDDPSPTYGYSYEPTQGYTYRPGLTISYEPTNEPTYAPTYEPTYAPTLPVYDRLPGLDDSYEGHLFLDMKGLGDCTRMTGKIVVTFLMVDDADGAWTDADLADFEATVHAATQELYIDARDYNVPVTIISRFVRCTSNGKLAMQNSRDWAESAVTSAGFSFTTGCTDVAAEYGADQATFFLCVNRTGRSFAHPAYGRTGFEYGVLYREHGDYRHELNHLFGAEDFYYPTEVQDLSKQLLPNSIMNDSNNSMVDELTAYLIGWTDVPGPNAIAFLDRTASITQDDMSKAYAESTYTGYGTRRWGEGYFTGSWVDGIPEGYGTSQSDNGDYYEGDHVYGSRHGQGTFRWATGPVYVGAWDHGQMHGYGVYTWEGNRYEGDFAEGVAQGKGTYTWANGCSYTGDVQNWALTGYGTYRWADGAVYVGDWVNGNMHGYGTCTYANGTQRTGTWQNGNFIG